MASIVYPKAQTAQPPNNPDGNQCCEHQGHFGTPSQPPPWCVFKHMHLTEQDLLISRNSERVGTLFYDNYFSTVVVAVPLRPYYVDQAGLEFMIFLPHPLDC